jgi:hypothetical protein
MLFVYCGDDAVSAWFALFFRMIRKLDTVVSRFRTGGVSSLGTASGFGRRSNGFSPLVRQGRSWGGQAGASVPFRGPPEAGIVTCYKADTCVYLRHPTEALGGGPNSDSWAKGCCSGESEDGGWREARRMLRLGPWQYC